MKKTDGYFGDFGGRYSPEILTPALEELEKIYNQLRGNKKFHKKLKYYLKNYAGRPSPITYAENLSRVWGSNIWLKREDLNHTGAHKINNTIGQALLTLEMGKKRIIAETGAGQHGVATATVGAMFGLKTVIYMGNEDLRRQELNAIRMRMLGAEVIGVSSGTMTLKDATSEAMRDWALNVDSTHYIVGSSIGPHPFPTIVRDFQRVIGTEAKKQFLKRTSALPDAVVACVGGGSNAIGIFYGFLNHKSVKLYGVEAGGRGDGPGEHSATITFGKPGYLHGTKTLLIQDSEGQILPPHSISAGLDYPGVGPEHAYFSETGRVKYFKESDSEALGAFQEVCRLEGIIPALESSHALSYAKKLAKKFGPERHILVNLSGRGDKDVAEANRLIGEMK
ncbi:MAG: tryptophan synthase subunit beta [Leptospiraceae bacterium]|nr:tryptophan synthase subunit beta [Leptospiraceae bacterium]MCP5513453.1 tryptophan synthase subunit beta [Leptospiraceae bacterium]